MPTPAGGTGATHLRRRRRTPTSTTGRTSPRTRPNRWSAVRGARAATRRGGSGRRTRSGTARPGAAPRGADGPIAPSCSCLLSGQAVDQPGYQCGALRYSGHQYVFTVGVRAATDRTESVQRRGADAGREVAVRPATDMDL